MKQQLWENVPALQEAATTVQYFGLGFVQVKLGVEQRLHYYHPDLPVSVSEESVHNHRYDFTSKVLKGMLQQELFATKIFQKPTHFITSESCEPGTEESGQFPVAITHQATLQLPAGSEYWIARSQLHRVKAIGKTITHLTRPLEHAVPFADVATPIDQPLVCPFESDLTEDELWGYVDDTIR